MATLPKLVFTEEGHLYHRDGQIIPSVTQVLSLCGIGVFGPEVPRRFIERAGEIGKAVHACCHYLEEGTLDVETVDPAISGYAFAYHKFREKHAPHWTHMEEPMVLDGDFPFAGTPDRIGTLTLENELMRCVVDIKTAKQKQSWWPLQTSGYYLLAGGDPVRLVLHLKESGEFTLRAHRDETDIEIFRSVLKVAHWRLANGARL